MAIPVYLAMTAEQFHPASPHGCAAAWLDCHFSPDGSGLAGLPLRLPSGTPLMINDRFPPERGELGRLRRQTVQAVESLGCSAVILDFQREDRPEQQALAEELREGLPCPVIVSDRYAKGLACPVFLSPCPHHVPLREHLLPWQGREIWLDLAADAQTMTLTAAGCTVSTLPMDEISGEGFGEKALHCHYRAETGEDFARFILWRTAGDLEALAQEAEALGVKALVGLWQEWQ